MNPKLREKAVMATLAVVALYVLAVFVWFGSARESWARAARNYAKAKAKYAEECRVIAEESTWTKAYEDERAAMPMFEVGKSTDTSWQRKMSDLALRHRIQITQSKAGEEVDAGEVKELPIEVSSWEGSLDALVHFMYELENSTEGMFALDRLSFKPSSKKGYFRGSFTLKCAYMREE